MNPFSCDLETSMCIMNHFKSKRLYLPMHNGLYVEVTSDWHPFHFLKIIIKVSRNIGYYSSTNIFCLLFKLQSQVTMHKCNLISNHFRVQTNFTNLPFFPSFSYGLGTHGFLYVVLKKCMACDYCVSSQLDGWPKIW